MRVFVAIRAFFRALVDGDFARRVALLLGGASVSEAPAQARPEATAAPAKAKTERRSDAISLLAALEREGRLVDFLQESLEGYNDAQIGAAARDVHRDCAAVLRRMFALEPVLAETEGAVVEVPSGYDTGVYRLTGNVTGQPPFRGTMIHHGWRATACQVPAFSGSREGALVVAPAEIELK